MSRRVSALVTIFFVLSFLLPVVPAAAQVAEPDDWRAGAAAVSDNFSRNSGQWTVDTGSGALRTISRGRLNILIPEVELFRWSTLDTGDSYKDFYVEFDARHVAGPVDAMMGVIFRYTDSDNFYAFVVSADGWYALLKYVDGEVSRPADWAESDALETGEGAVNRLAVLANGREIALYVNDEELERAQDRSFSEGSIALLAGTNNDGDLEVSFDNFGLWNKPGSSSGTPSVGRKSLSRSTPTAPERASNAADAVVNTDALNVRGGPGTNYPVVGTLKKGDGVRIIGRSADNKWAKLGFGDVDEAWASVQFLTINIDFPKVAVAKAPAAPAASQPPSGPPAKKNVAYLDVENHIGRYITVQVNDQNFRVEGKVGNTPGRYRFELQGVGRYRLAAQLPNGGSSNMDLYVEETAAKCAQWMYCVPPGYKFTWTIY